jgi:AcrR family transcriptional regulator
MPREEGFVTDSAAEDRRVLRSRQALIEAFRALVVERPYDEISVGDVIDKAGVGRSTFYEHYQNKDDLLRASVGGALEALANMTTAAHDPEQLRFWIGNLWDNRTLGRILLAGQAGVYLARCLAALIEERLAVETRNAAMIKPPPAKLVAMTMAQAELGLIHAWLSAVAASTAEATCELLHRIACAMAKAAYRPD